MTQEPTTWKDNLQYSWVAVKNDQEKAYAGAMGKKECATCALPAEARLAVETAIERHEPLKSIAAKIGISKSSLSRHHLRCMANALMTRYRKKSNPMPSRIICKWYSLDDKFERYAIDDKTIAASEVRSTDCVLVVHYQQLDVAEIVRRGNPRALNIASNPRILDELHEIALAEDLERAKAREKL